MKGWGRMKDGEVVKGDVKEKKMNGKEDEGGWEKVRWKVTGIRWKGKKDGRDVG